jgi:CRP/FNR family transcriptional regulator
LTQVVGFALPGDVMGLDGIDTGLHASEAVALEDAEVFVLPMALCRLWIRESAHGPRLFARAMACEIARTQETMLMLGTMLAQQRLAMFLLDLSERYGRLGYSRVRLVLRMTRQDIGSYLGLTFETVSRLLARLQDEGAIRVDGRMIDLRDIPALWRLSGLSPDCARPQAVAIVDREGELLIA